MSSHSDLIIANPPLLNQEKKIMKLVASEPGKLCMYKNVGSE